MVMRIVMMISRVGTCGLHSGVLACRLCSDLSLWYGSHAFILYNGIGSSPLLPSWTLAVNVREKISLCCFKLTHKQLALSYLDLLPVSYYLEWFQRWADALGWLRDEYLKIKVWGSYCHFTSCHYQMPHFRRHWNFNVQCVSPGECPLTKFWWEKDGYVTQEAEAEWWGDETLNTVMSTDVCARGFP